MIIDGKILSSFLAKVAVEGIEECVLDFNEQELSVCSTNNSNTTMVICSLNKKSFNSYETLGKVGVNNLTKLNNALNSMSSEVVISKKDNLLMLCTKTSEFDLVLPHLDTIPTPSKLPELSFDINFNLNSEILRKVMKCSEIVEKGASITFRGDNKKLIIESGNDDKFRELVYVPEIISDLKVKFSEPLKQVFTVLDGVVNISLKSDYPIKIMQKTEQASFVYIVAPLNSEE